MPGKKPWVQVLPPSVEVAQPMSVEPPGAMRPVWKAETMVEPLAKVCGSTWVACWPGPTLNGSELTLVKLTCASAGTAHNDNAITPDNNTAARINAAKVF